MPNWSLRASVWPDQLREVPLALEHRHGPSGELSASGPYLGSSTPSVVLTVFDDEGREAVEWLDALTTDTELNVVVVLSDGYLGTDASERSHAMLGASAVSAVRSLAATRGTKVRANVVCIPEALVGGGGEHTGPLAHSADAADVVEAVSFFMDPANDYVSGQVLFVDGGRHLFSSHTA